MLTPCLLMPRSGGAHLLQTNRTLSLDYITHMPPPKAKVNRVHESNVFRIRTIWVSREKKKLRQTMQTEESEKI